MPRSIQAGLKVEHILQALADLDSVVEHPFGAPTGYELVHEGKRYPPKAVIGLAIKHLDGRTTGPDDFSGGEGPGQANSILRNLGFEVVRKPDPPSPKRFVTSRGDNLPNTAQAMSEKLSFSIWQRRHWPYNELQPGDTLYWFDTTRHTLVWKSRVSSVEKFEFTSEAEVRERLERVFGVEYLSDPYLDAAPDRGCCLAYRVDCVVSIDLPKPANYRFPQLGWLRCDDEEAREWLARLRENGMPDGRIARELEKVVTELDDEGYFSPSDLTDQRRRVVRSIAQRRGQAAFRSTLIVVGNGKCSVTGCDVQDALEAAHIVPYCGEQSHHVANGLLLRADIHTLFDLNLIGIDPDTMTIVLAPQLRRTSYADLHGKQLAMPANDAHRPNYDALTQRWQQFSAMASHTWDGE